MAFINEIVVKGTKYLAVKDSTGKKVLRWLGRMPDQFDRDGDPKLASVAKIRKAIKDFRVDLFKMHRRRAKRDAKKHAGADLLIKQIKSGQVTPVRYGTGAGS
jgi:hypothetical protein